MTLHVSLHAEGWQEQQQAHTSSVAQRNQIGLSIQAYTRVTRSTRAAKALMHNGFGARRKDLHLHLQLHNLWHIYTPRHAKTRLHTRSFVRGARANADSSSEPTESIEKRVTVCCACIPCIRFFPCLQVFAVGWGRQEHQPSLPPWLRALFLSCAGGLIPGTVAVCGRFASKHRVFSVMLGLCAVGLLQLCCILVRKMIYLSSPAHPPRLRSSLGRRNAACTTRAPST